ncbi:MAG: protein-glutamate O-methyltransferase CheR [Deltaproteobacteria bacterium]|nr:protein-glutamate O-methyltransferase CheR [Deltaproteobacteria bacterium]
MLSLGLSNRPKLSPETFRLLRDVIYVRSGIAFAEAKTYLLETRLSRRLEIRGLKTFEDYYYFLTYDPEREQEFTQLLNVIVTNETSFFRDQTQLDVFSKGVVPRIMEEKSRSGSKNLRIWSAACSTGEEPYTLAMLLMEAGLPAKGWTIEIVASDISEIVLRAAEAGHYDKYSLRNTPDVYQKKYFSNSADAFSIKESVRGFVRYKRINLIEANDTRSVIGFDVIFCRNVFIYFDDVSKKRAVSHLYDSLARGGYLFVGFSESLHNITRLFKPVSIDRSLVYQKA